MATRTRGLAFTWSGTENIINHKYKAEFILFEKVYRDLNLEAGSN